MNPSLGRNFEALDSLEWLARMSDHIPDPGQHRTILYGQYANRVRGARQRDEAELQETSAEPPRRRSSPTWARLIARVLRPRSEARATSWKQPEGQNRRAHGAS